jgi:hypothetical protein
MKSVYRFGGMPQFAKLDRAFQRGLAGYPMSALVATVD